MQVWRNPEKLNYFIQIGLNQVKALLAFSTVWASFYEWNFIEAGVLHFHQRLDLTMSKTERRRRRLWNVLWTACKRCFVIYILSPPQIHSLCQYKSMLTLAVKAAVNIRKSKNLKVLRYQKIFYLCRKDSKWANAKNTVIVRMHFKFE